MVITCQPWSLQAHGIDKLAKRIFHVLRTNPENFEAEFSGNRRRSCRRSQDETNELNCKSFLKNSEKNSTATTDACLHNSTYFIYKSFLENPRFASKTTQNNLTEHIC